MSRISLVCCSLIALALSCRDRIRAYGRPDARPSIRRRTYPRSSTTDKSRCFCNDGAYTTEHGATCESDRYHRATDQKYSKLRYSCGHHNDEFFFPQVIKPLAVSSQHLCIQLSARIDGLLLTVIDGVTSRAGWSAVDVYGFHRTSSRTASANVREDGSSWQVIAERVEPQITRLSFS